MPIDTPGVDQDQINPQETGGEVPKNPEASKSPEASRDEVLEAGHEAIQVATQLLEKSGIACDSLFAEMKASEFSDEDLAQFDIRNDGMRQAVEVAIADVQRALEAAQQTDELDVFAELLDPVDTVALEKQKKGLGHVQKVVEARSKRLSKETLDRQENLKRPEREKMAREQFANSMERSQVFEHTISVFSALESVDSEKVQAALLAKAEQPDAVHPIRKQELEKAKTILERNKERFDDKLNSALETIQKSRINIAEQRKDIAEQRKDIADRLPKSEKLKNMEAILADPKNVMHKRLKDGGQLDVAQGKVADLLQKELDDFSVAEKSRLDQEEVDLKVQETTAKEKHAQEIAPLDEKYNKERLQILRQDQELLDGLVPELLRGDIDLDAVSTEIAQRFTRLLEDSPRDFGIRYALRLPEAVLDKVVDGLSVDQVKAIVDGNRNAKTEYSAIYWSKSFERRARELQVQGREPDYGSQKRNELHEKVQQIDTRAQSLFESLPNTYSESEEKIEQSLVAIESQQGPLSYDQKIILENQIHNLKSDIDALEAIQIPSEFEWYLKDLNPAMESSEELKETVTNVIDEFKPKVQALGESIRKRKNAISDRYQTVKAKINEQVRQYNIDHADEIAARNERDRVNYEKYRAELAATEAARAALRPENRAQAAEEAAAAERARLAEAEQAERQLVEPRKEMSRLTDTLQSQQKSYERRCSERDSYLQKNKDRSKKLQEALLKNKGLEKSFGIFHKKVEVTSISEQGQEETVSVDKREFGIMITNQELTLGDLQTAQTRVEQEALVEASAHTGIIESITKGIQALVDKFPQLKTST